MVSAIFIGESILPDCDYAFISEGSFSVFPLIYPVADLIEEKYPVIFEKAYHSLPLGVYLCYLNADEFRNVYELTKAEYENFIKEDRPLITGIIEENRLHKKLMMPLWNKYIYLLENDPRLK